MGTWSQQKKNGTKNCLLFLWTWRPPIMETFQLDLSYTWNPNGSGWDPRGASPCRTVNSQRTQRTMLTLSKDKCYFFEKIIIPIPISYIIYVHISATCKPCKYIYQVVKILPLVGVTHHPPSHRLTQHTPQRMPPWTRHETFETSLGTSDPAVEGFPWSKKLLEFIATFYPFFVSMRCPFLWVFMVRKDTYKLGNIWATRSRNQEIIWNPSEISVPPGIPPWRIKGRKNIQSRKNLKTSTHFPSWHHFHPDLRMSLSGNLGHNLLRVSFPRVFWLEHVASSHPHWEKKLKKPTVFPLAKKRRFECQVSIATRAPYHPMRMASPSWAVQLMGKLEGGKWD